MIVLKPAYGRDYKTAAQVKADWLANKDFIICNAMHPYCGKPANKDDLKADTNQVEIRYSALRKLVIINTERQDEN